MATPPFLPDESKPADADIVSQYPPVERLFRDIVESWLLVDHDTAGEHKQVTLPESAGDPTAAANTGFLYTKDDGADTELYYRDDSGGVVQLTRDGLIAVFPATTSMLFYQSLAPTGWTKDVAATLGNHALRLMTDVAWSGGSKGADAFDAVFNAGISTDDFVLLETHIPSHIHATSSSDTGTPHLFAGGAGGDFTGGNTAGPPVAPTGGGSGHAHTLALDLNYINVIRATKD